MYGSLRTSLTFESVTKVVNENAAKAIAELEVDPTMNVTASESNLAFYDNGDAFILSSQIPDWQSKII